MTNVITPRGSNSQVLANVKIYIVYSTLHFHVETSISVKYGNFEDRSRGEEEKREVGASVARTFRVPSGVSYIYTMHLYQLVSGPPSDSRGTDLSCHLTALLHQTDLSPSFRDDDDVQSITVFVVSTRDRVPNFFLIQPDDLCLCVVTSYLLLLTRDSVRCIRYSPPYVPATLVTRSLHARSGICECIYGVWYGRGNINFPIRIFFVIKGFNHFHGNEKKKKIVISIPAKYLVNIYGTFSVFVI